MTSHKSIRDLYELYIKLSKALNGVQNGNCLLGFFKYFCKVSNLPVKAS